MRLPFVSRRVVEELEARLLRLHREIADLKEGKARLEHELGESQRAYHSISGAAADALDYRFRIENGLQEPGLRRGDIGRLNDEPGRRVR